MKATHVLFIAATFIISNIAHASGFGWYVTSIPWKDFEKEMKGLEDEAIAVIKSSPQSAPLKKYFQTQLNNSAVEACQSKKTLYRHMSPLWQEFYPIDTLKYARERQLAAGKKSTWFNQFFSQPVHFPRIYTQNSERAEPYFLVPAKMVSEFYEEVRELNQRESHPAEHRQFLRHLEGVLLTTSSDFHPGLPEEMNTGLIFCGHD